MKNSRYFPFERNRFFYGKLLTVRDFESEQKYFNDKRRLINRLLHGHGVVAGLQVVAVDEKSISVEMGMALDSLGREIVIPSPVTLKLSTIEGFSNNEYSKNVYLCIAYDEKGREPVHSVANSSIQSDEVSEYNRLAEGYRLFIKEEPPNPDQFEWSQLFEDKTILYEDDSIRMIQATPRYVNPGETFDVTVTVEKTLQTPRISFTYDIVTSPEVSNIDEEGQTISFMEQSDLDGQRNKYEFSYKLQAGINYEQDHVQEVISIYNNKIHLNIGDRQLDIETDGRNTVEVIKSSVKERMMKRYFDRNLEESVRQTEDQSIYLAKIGLIQMGPSYIIEKVDAVPFGEYIYTATMLHRLEEAVRKAIDTNFVTNTVAKSLPSNEKPSLHVDYNDDRNLFHFEMGIPKHKKDRGEVASGILELELDPEEGGGKGIFVKGGKYFSEEIEHGLGLGATLVNVGVESSIWSEDLANLAGGKGPVYLGDYEVFKGTEYELELQNFSLGTIVYPDKGTFIVGVKADNIYEQLTLTLRWWAYRKYTAEEMAEEE